MTNGVFIIEVDELKLENITNEAPILTVYCVFRLSNESSLDDGQLLHVRYRAVSQLGL